MILVNLVILVNLANLAILTTLVILANLVVLVILVNLVKMTHCQDHILTENIWFVFSYEEVSPGGTNKRIRGDSATYSASGVLDG